MSPEPTPGRPARRWDVHSSGRRQLSGQKLTMWPCHNNLGFMLSGFASACVFVRIPCLGHLLCMQWWRTVSLLQVCLHLQDRLQHYGADFLFGFFFFFVYNVCVPSHKHCIFEASKYVWFVCICLLAHVLKEYIVHDVKGRVQLGKN